MIGVLHHRVNDALRVDNDFYLFRRNVEKPSGFDDLQAFVHHSRGIDGNFISHLPVRMVQRLGNGDPAQLLQGKAAEGPARGGQYNSVYVLVIVSL